MKFGNYLIREHDTLELIAAQQLGNAARWTEIAAINRLRWPFLSDDPADQLGEPLYTTALVQPYAGGLAIATSGYDAASFAAGTYVLLAGTGGAQGQPFWDLVTVFGWGTALPSGQFWSAELTGALSTASLASLPTGNVLYLASSPSHSYAAGTPVALYADPTLGRTRVLGTGMTLLLPITGDLSNVLTISDDEYATLLGTDLAIDRDGFLSLASRDFATVTGTANLAQALRVRLTTELGALVRHPDFGDDLLRYVGSTDPNLLTIAYATVSQCVLGDPRVERVAAIAVTQADDTLAVSVSVMLRDRSALVNLTDIILAGQ